MTLRARLTLAFFAISVIPLTAVTVFSYYSSERALRRAAEQQAATMANELGRRMEWVANDLQRRMDRVWPGERPAGGDSAAASTGGGTVPPATDMAGHLAAVLGDAAPMIESLELTPRVPPAPPSPGAPARTGRRPPPPPDPGTASSVPALPVLPPEAKVSIEMSRVIDKTMAQYAGAAGRGESAWSKAMQDRIREATASLASGADARQITEQLRAAQRDIERNRTLAEQAQADRLSAVTEMKGADLNSSVQRDGREVGRIHARLNMPRLFRAIMPGRRDGEIGFAIDASGEIHAPDTEKATLRNLKAAGAIPAEGATLRSKGDWVVVTRKGPGGMTFGTARPLGHDLQDLRMVAVRNFGAGFALVALVFLGSAPLAAGMTRNLRTLMQGVRGIAGGNLDTRVPVKSKDEFGQLAAAFNQMAEGLAAHQRLVVQQERLQRELELCRQIQNEMLPHAPLRLGLAEINGVSIPAREVGGDFFNYFVLPTGELAVVVGDVSGKGVGAALLMANVQATLRARLPMGQNLAQLADELDRDLAANTPIEVYLTAFIGVVSPDTHVLRYVNAGHNTQFIVRRGNGLQPMESTGRPLGLVPGGGYEERSMELPTGDLLFFYTDGIIEVENEAGDLFGTDRLEAVLQQQPTDSQVDDLLARVEQAVREFRGRAEPSDDATMMALRFGN